MEKKVMLNIKSSKVQETLRCEDCGATAARNGNAFTAFTLKVHRGRMHKVKHVHGNSWDFDLTERQQEIMERIATGKLERLIAAEMGLSYHTVHAHVRAIYKKVGANSRVAAVNKFLEQKNGSTRTVEPQSLPSLRYCPGCGCHLATVTAAMRPS